MPIATTALCGTSSVQVLHSRHYHAALLRALYEADDVDGSAILVAGVEACGAGVVAARPAGRPAPGWDWLEARFRRVGLGDLSLSRIGASGEGTATLPNSHFAAAWRDRYSETGRPVCAVVAGLLAGALSAACDRPLLVRETHCVAQGAKACTFRASSAPASALRDPDLPHAGQTPDWPGVEAGAGVAATLLGHALEGDRSGVIGGPGGPFVALPAEFYATVTRLFELEIPRNRGAKFGNLPGILLTEAAHRNGFHLFGEILSSSEWRDGVEPGLTSDRERLAALFGVVGQLGWGSWEIHAFVPGERLIVRVSDSYEAEGHTRRFGRSESPRCTVLRGAAAALMNLLYRAADPPTADLSPTLYNALFRSPHTFRASETRCRAQGEPFCEVVVNPLTV